MILKMYKRRTAGPESDVTSDIVPVDWRNQKRLDFPSVFTAEHPELRLKLMNLIWIWSTAVVEIQYSHRQEQEQTRT